MKRSYEVRWITTCNLKGVWFCKYYVLHARKYMGNKQAIHFDFNNMMAEMIGSEHGITDHDLKDIKPVASAYVKNMKEERSAGKLQFLDLPYNKKTVEEVLKTVTSIKGKFRNLVVVGIGGSALGNIAIHTAMNHPFHNLLTDVERNNTPRIFVLDNIDPDRFSGLLDIVTPGETLFNFITKSGTTAETMSQFLIITKLLQIKQGNCPYRFNADKGHRCCGSTFTASALYGRAL